MAKVDPANHGKFGDMHYGVTILGNHESTVALIDSLIADGLTPDLVVTLGTEGRGKVTIASGHHDMAGACRDRGIAVYECSGYRLVSDRDRAFFADNQFGIGVCTDWQHLIPGHVLAVFDDGIYGFHGSLMAFPNGRGRSPFNWSIRLGGTSILHNCFRYTEGADDGGVFNTSIIPIGPEDPIRTVQFKAMVDSRITIRRLLQARLAGEIRLTPQPTTASVWLPKLTPADSVLEFEAIGIEAALNVIRASSRPFAGAYCLSSEGERAATIWRAVRYDGPIDPHWEAAPVGAVLVAAMDGALIKCRDGLLLATELSVPAEQLAGMHLR